MLLNRWRCLRGVAVLLVVALPLRADETLLAHWSFDRLETDGKQYFADASSHGRAIPLLADTSAYDLQLTSLDDGRALLLTRDWLYHDWRLPAEVPQYTVEMVLFVAAGPAGRSVTEEGVGLQSPPWTRSLLRIGPMLGTPRRVDRDALKPGLQIVVDHVGALTLALADGTVVRTQPRAVRRDLWQHVAATVNPQQASLWINGREVSSSPRPAKPASLPSGLLSIGQLPFGQASVPSIAIDELRVLSRVVDGQLMAHRWAQLRGRYPVVERPVAAEPVTLSVMTYNTFHGFRGYWLPKAGQAAPASAPLADRPPPEVARYLQPIFAETPLDFLGLQEVELNQPVVRELASLLDTPAEFVARGGAALVRRPVGRPQSFLPLDFNDTYRGQTRHLYRCRFHVPGHGPVDAFAVHLWPAVEELVEDVQILQVLDDQRRLGVPQVLLGDFNRRPEGELFRRLQQRGWSTRSSQVDPARQGTKVVGHSSIDGIWWRGLDDWEVLECQPLCHERAASNDDGFAASDHLPVRAVWRRTTTD